MIRTLLAAGLVTFFSTSAFSAVVDSNLVEEIDNELSTMHSGMMVKSDEPPTQIVTVEISAVPLPAAGLMLLAGLGGLAMLRRRAA